MDFIKRRMDLALPTGKSAFLWGPRKIGKTTYLKKRFSNGLFFDFLKGNLFLEFSKRPWLLREQLLAQEEKQAPSMPQPIILDEVQKIPTILDEVHWMIENKRWQFILCGSSARKLKRGHANLLGGRAWRYEMYPLVSVEIGEGFDLLRALNQGLIPSHYLEDKTDSAVSLQSYVQDYLKEEIFAEGLTRNIPAFSRFFDAVGYSHGELINYSNIARDCGVDSKTVREYYQILVDTLMGTLIPPFRKRQHRQVISKACKFYLFDVGVAGILTHRHVEETRGEAFGRAFEHFLLMELLAYRSYHRLDFPIHFWRTKTGLEVDFILGDGEIAVEIKGKSLVDSSDMRALRTFVEEYHPRKAIVVSTERERRVTQGVSVFPWKEFLADLWSRKII